MEDFLAGAVDGGAAAQLQQAPGIGGDNGLGASGLGVAHFLGKKFQRSLGLRDVVESRGAAADFRVGQFHKIEVGNLAQKLARSFANFLAVKEMAGILISDANGKRLHFCSKAKSSQEFGNVASFGRKRAGLHVLGLVR